MKMKRMDPPSTGYSRRRAILAAGAAGTVALAGCMSDTSDDAAGDDDTDVHDCDPGAETVTDPDGDAAVAVILKRSPLGADGRVSLEITRVELLGADVASVAYDVDRTVDIGGETDESVTETDGTTVVDREPIPVGTYSGLRIYGTVIETEGIEETAPTLLTGDGEYVESTFGAVFEPDERKEFELTTQLNADFDGENYEIGFSSRITSSW